MSPLTLIVSISKRKEERPMKTLLINAHPDYENTAHYSLKLMNLFQEKFYAHYPQEKLTLLNLYDTTIPSIEEGQLLTIWDKELQKIPLSLEENKIKQLSLTLLNQFKNHHRIVIASPLHNFNIPSRLKDYLDNILIARETFKYLDIPKENGKASIGLMTNDYKMILLYASGSIYTNNDFYEKMDFAPKYLTAMFQEVMGFSDVEVLRAEGTAFLSEKEIMAPVKKQFNEIFQTFYA